MENSTMTKESPQRKKSNKGKRFFGGMLVLLFLGGLLIIALVPERVEVETAQVRRGSFEEVIRADGLLRSKERYIVPAFANGDIQRIEWKVGDPIKKGDIITKIYWDIRYDPLFSPLTGVISKVFQESAGPVQRGTPLVEIVNPDNLEAVAELLTTDALRVSLGDSVLIYGWGEGQEGEGIPGEVVRVSRAGFTKVSPLGVAEERTEVVIQPKGKDHPMLKKFGDQFHVDLSLIVHQEQDALTIPIGAIYREGEQWAVYQVLEGRAKKKIIQMDRRGYDRVMIKGGLQEGDQIILYPGDFIKEDLRVQSLP